MRETCNGPGTRAPCHLVTSQLPGPLAPEVPGFVCSNEWPPPGVARRPHPGPFSLPQLPPGWRKQHPSRLYPPQAQNPTLRRGWRLLLPPLKSTRSNSGKEMSREGEGWEDQIRDGSVPANHTRSLPGPPVLGCPNYLLRLERCLAGSGALGSKPHSALLSPAPRTTLLG